MPEKKSDKKKNTSGTGELQIKELSNLKILRHVGIESVWGLLESCAVRVLKKGEVLFSTGQSNQTMYMILSGKLSVHLDNMASKPIAYLEPGQTVGEISVIDNSPASAYVVALNTARLLAVDEETFWRLVQVSHEFATNLLLMLTQRLRANNFAITEKEHQKKHFQVEAMVDILTGLHNRRWLDYNIPRIVQRFSKTDSPLTILIIDIDYFKSYNDTYGHSAGDQALAIVARMLMTHIRPTDLSARYGGEEFVVILPDTDTHNAYRIAERLKLIIGKTPIEIFDGSVLPPVTVSIGIAQLSTSEGPSEFFARADAALYRAKKKGRNCVEC